MEIGINIAYERLFGNDSCLRVMTKIGVIEVQLYMAKTKQFYRSY